MIHELGTYPFHGGKLPAYLKLAEEVGRPIRGNDYGTNLGYWTPEFGTLNQIWHLWQYEDLGARAAFVFQSNLQRHPTWRLGQSGQFHRETSRLEPPIQFARTILFLDLVNLHRQFIDCRFENI